MALDDIKAAILAEATKSAQAITADGQAKTAALKADWDRKLETKKQELLTAAKQKTIQKIQQSRLKLQAQAQTELITQKQKLIDKVYKQALTKLSELTDDQYVDLMVKLINRLPELEGKLLSVKDKESLLKKALKKSGHKFELADETVHGQGGFYFTSKTIDINYTFSSLINSTREETLLEIAAKLFNENQTAE